MNIQDKILDKSNISDPTDYDDLNNLLDDIEGIINNIDSEVEGDISSVYSLSAKELGIDVYEQILPDEPEDIEVDSGYEELSEYDSRVNEAWETILDQLEDIETRLDDADVRLENFFESHTMRMSTVHRHLLQKKLRVREFFGEVNMGYIKRVFFNQANGNRLQFEPPQAERETPYYEEVLLLLITKLDQILINTAYKFEKIITDYEQSITRIEAAYLTQKSKATIKTKQALEAGALRVDLEDRLTESRQHAVQVNTGTDNIPSFDNGRPVFPKIHVPVPLNRTDTVYLDSITEDGSEHFTFQEEVVKMGYNAREMYLRGADGIINHQNYWREYENRNDSGWKMIIEENPAIFIYLSRVAERLGKKLTLNSCYRSLYYNLIVLKKYKGYKAARNSAHTTAKAVDISTNGMSNLDVANLITYCSQEGFNRISCYDTFIHADIQDGSYRGDWTKNYRGNRDIEDAMVFHLTNQFKIGAKV